tara:strand:- start:376 stop:1341 length:966 start_codon:yes stop_codon:yes gene_type:complete
MATVTLAESAKLALNDLVSGVIENIITVNSMFEVLPFDGIDGNALSFNRENALGPVAAVAVGEDIGSAVASGGNQTERTAAKNAATFTNLTVSLITLMGDAEVNGLIEMTRSSEGNNQTAVQIGSKAKSAGRKYQNVMVNGVSGTNNEFDGLLALLSAGQTAATGANGGALSFAFIDEMIDLVTDKDGAVDWMMFHARTIRSFRALLRSLGGASIAEVVTMPSGQDVPSYGGIPIFRNDWNPINQVKGSGSAQTTIFAGTLDDGSRQHGIAGLTASKQSGVNIVDVGVSETRDEHIWRVLWYCGLVNFSQLGLAGADGITN